MKQSIRGILNAFLLLAGLCAGRVEAQVVRITYPESRAVFQRNNDQTSTIFVSGSYYQPVDSVQARLVFENVGQGLTTAWQTIQRNPQGGIFQGPVRGTTGWYRLEVRAFSGRTVIGEDVVRKVGIGEVFIVTGQSNAQGFQDLGAAGATDDRVNCVDYDNFARNSLADPPAPKFQQLSASALIGPRGQSAWCWGILGDLIAKQYNCPVLFINTAWAGTTIRNWTESADGKITKNIFRMGTPDENFPVGMPYGNLIIALRYYSSLFGLRAVLWQQGETDNVPLNLGRQEYATLMQYLVNKTRADTDRYPAWILARSSYNQGKVSENIIQAQSDVINVYNNNVLPGPFTDAIQRPRPGDDVHFGGDGLRQLAQAWYNSMDAIFFTSSLPLLPLPQPAITVSCAPNGVSIRLPNAASYSWQSGQTTQTLSVTAAGTYRATLKDAKGNTFLAPAVEVADPIQPATPTITLARQPGSPAATELQVCSDSVLTLSVNSPANNRITWNTGAVSRTLTVGAAGAYTVQATNLYGCRSAQSAPVNLVVRPRLVVPVIAQAGTYSLKATVPAASGFGDFFDWRRGSNTLQNQSTSIAKVGSSGTYTARAKTVYTLNNGSSITCYSSFSNPFEYVLSEADQGMSVYPNPSKDGVVYVETLEDLPNAEVSVYSLTGQLVFTTTVASFNQRQLLPMSSLAKGQYVVRVRSAGFNVSKRFVVD
ncbi:T9SS type A sorting domain-containing protein [Rudanella paleaurantiibacter]|uniref:T9SS type A sorting domain-containing protein n=1 Tax=Rudanella paleaurantiibacter TaxID=2614655 RepID=A0A7J5U2G7_9BACT|nr:sialate O-acetylesterase [Rudanella paleaurantiibacter]KAB7731871.1 T9SS type A sorting domain-containing protein [Rudanella paleaurantiibacter]